MKEIELPRKVCAKLITWALRQDKELWTYLDKTETNGTKFRYLVLNKDDAWHEALTHLLPELDFNTVRVHEFLPDEQTHEHTDTAYPDCDTMVMPLRRPCEDRFVVDRRIVKEFMGIGLIIPKNTLHQVLRGDTVRHTLTIWINN